MALIINNETISDETIKTQFDKTYHLISENQKNDKTKESVLHYVKRKIIENTLLQQTAEAELFDIPYGEIKGEYEKMIHHYGGVESFKEKINSHQVNEIKIKTQIENNLKIESLLKSWTANIPTPPEKKLIDFYEKNKRDSYLSNERVIVSALMVNQDDTEGVSQIEKLYHLFLKTGDYEEIVQMLQSTQKDKNKILEKIEYKPKIMIERGSVSLELENIIFELKRGEVSDLVKAQNSISIFKHIEYIPESVWQYNEIKNKIIHDFTRKDREEVIKKKITDLINEADIKDDVVI